MKGLSGSLSCIHIIISVIIKKKSSNSKLFCLPIAKEISAFEKCIS